MTEFKVGQQFQTDDGKDIEICGFFGRGRNRYVCYFFLEDQQKSKIPKQFYAFKRWVIRRPDEDHPLYPKPEKS